jgi:acyl-coenzyme A thioesterase PaaI-like protein
MKERLVGNPYYKILHGGIISSVLDTVGGHTVYLNVFHRLKGKSPEKQLAILSKLGTIDLRIDFLILPII